MILNYVALVILLVALTLVFYTFIYIHDIPYDIAKKRNHPQKEVIHVACWLSLFTLHAIWPLVFMWAISNPKPIEVMVHDRKGFEPADGDMSARLAELEKRLQAIERARTGSEGGVNHA